MEIEWPARPKRIPEDRWERKKKMVQVLCEMGEVVEWSDVNGHVPYVYQLGQTCKAQFLPDWGQYYLSVTDTHTFIFRDPENPTQEAVSAAILAARELLDHGFINVKQ